MIEITTKFKSCFEDETLQRETINFKTENGQDLGQVVLRQLKRGEITELADKSAEEYLIKCIESWTFLKDSKPLELNLENLKLLSSTKKVGNEYSLGIIDNLFKIAVEMNLVSSVEEKN